MPEGDTLYRTAVTLRKALLGKTVTRFETSVDTVASTAENHPVPGRTVTAVEARGKHLLITLTLPASHDGDTEPRTPEHLNARPDVPTSLRTPVGADARMGRRRYGRTPERLIVH